MTRPTEPETFGEDANGFEWSRSHAHAVTRRLAIRYFWNLGRMGEIEKEGGRPIYQVFNAGKSPPRFFPRLETIRITRWLRFGNAIRQMRNALLAGERYAAHTISLPPHPFLAGDQVGRFRLDWSGEFGGQSLALAGEFFSQRPLRLYGPLHNEPRLLVEYIRPMLTGAIATPDPRVDPNDLVLHFRAGDVFALPCRAVGYGQPPLAYYLGAIEREKPSRVWLVAEDRSNPCVDAVESAMHAKGVDVVYQSAELEHDLRVLLSTRRLVMSRGTFASTVAALSSTLQKAYTFDPSPTLKRLGVHVVRGRDLRGDFNHAILERNWRATADQVAMLLSYPREAIGFTDMPSTWWRRNLWDSA